MIINSSTSFPGSVRKTQLIRKPRYKFSFWLQVFCTNKWPTKFDNIMASSAFFEEQMFSIALFDLKWLLYVCKYLHESAKRVEIVFKKQ